jgi:ubiquinone/menaquinone biosynthesis C-methylase UbiE
MKTVKDRRIPTFLTDNFLRRLFSPPEKMLSKFISAGQVVADIGSGPGYFTVTMAEIVGKEGHVYAADFDSRSIEALTRKAEKHNYSEIIDARTTSAANLSFIPNATVDFVFANGLLCCMLDHEGAVREVERILKPEGKAYLSITKRLRKKDPRTVGEDEWFNLLQRFDVLNQGQNFMSRWAIVNIKNVDRSRSTSKIKESEDDYERKKKDLTDNKQSISCCSP